MSVDVSLAPQSASTRGSTAAEIQSHYDAGNDFYQLWLDQTLSYSCALFDGEEELYPAQLRKLDHHLDVAGVAENGRLLDIGCGWGGLLCRAGERFPGLSRAGITLSRGQAELSRQRNPGAEIELVAWEDYTPRERFDSIVSIGAFEHFARVGASRSAKVDGYRAFFCRCWDWLQPSGRMSLQTIAYGNMDPEQQSEFLNTEIFPATEAPALDEIAEACRGLFEVISFRNDRTHYAETNRRWLRNLKMRRAEAENLVGPQKVRQYLDYLALSVVAFHVGHMELLRFGLRRIDEPKYGPARTLLSSPPLR